MSNYFKKIKSPRGFGILEMVIALGILMMGVIGFSTLTMATIVTSRTSELRIVAANLTREGVEVARNIRDSNWLKIDGGEAGVSWNSDLASATDYTAVATFDSTSGEWTLNFTANDFSHSDTKIYYDSTNSLYLQPQPSGPPGTIKETPFKRLITLNLICRPRVGGSDFIAPSPQTCLGSTPVADQVGVQVVSWVKWGEAGRTHEIKQEEKLYNWRIGM